MTFLEEIEGFRFNHQHMKMPFMVTNRSVIAGSYVKENDDGSVSILMTSTGNEDLYEKHKDKIGSDVVAINHFNYTRLKEVDGGCEVAMAASSDPAGSIPDMIKNKQVAKLQRGPTRQFHFMITGEVLDE